MPIDAASVPNVTPRVAINFWGHVKPVETGCWEWQGYRRKNGYGFFRLGIPHTKRRKILAHRWSFYLATGHWPHAPLYVLHSCANPSCVNPVHLRAGTHLENMRDKIKDGHTMVGDKNPSRLYPERYPRGEQHHSAKLTRASVLEAKHLYATGQYRLVDLAAAYNVSIATLHAAVRGKTWRSLSTDLGHV